MPTYLDRDISGDDTDVLPSNQVIYAVAWLSALGGDVREGDAHSGQILRAGWFSFGDLFNVIGATDREYWREPIYLNFQGTLWTPDPSTSGGGPLVLIASRVKWHLSVGTTGHLYVYGA